MQNTLLERLGFQLIGRCPQLPRAVRTAHSAATAFPSEKASSCFHKSNQSQWRAAAALWATPLPWTPPRDLRKSCSTWSQLPLAQTRFASDRVAADLGQRQRAPDRPGALNRRSAVAVAGAFAVPSPGPPSRHLLLAHLHAIPCSLTTSPLSMPTPRALHTARCRREFETGGHRRRAPAQPCAAPARFATTHCAWLGPLNLQVPNRASCPCPAKLR